MSDVNEEPTHSSFWLTFLAVTGCFLIFVLILWFAYLPRRHSLDSALASFSEKQREEIATMPDDQREALLARIPANLTREQRLDANILTPEERKERLIEMRGKEAAGQVGYHWIDRDKGIVRLPIDRAMELTVVELQQKQQAAH